MYEVTDDFDAEKHTRDVGEAEIEGQQDLQASLNDTNQDTDTFEELYKESIGDKEYDQDMDDLDFESNR